MPVPTPQETHRAKAMFEAILAGNEATISKVLAAVVADTQLNTLVFPLGEAAVMGEEFKLLCEANPSVDPLAGVPEVSCLTLAAMRGHENALGALIQMGGRFTSSDLVWVATALAQSQVTTAPEFMKARSSSLEKILRAAQAMQPELFNAWVGDARRPTQTVGQYLRRQAGSRLADELDVGNDPLRSPIFSRHKTLDDVAEGRGLTPGRP